MHPPAGGMVKMIFIAIRLISNGNTVNLNCPRWQPRWPVHAMTISSLRYSWLVNLLKLTRSRLRILYMFIIYNSKIFQVYCILYKILVRWSLCHMTYLLRDNRNIYKDIIHRRDEKTITSWSFNVKLTSNMDENVIPYIFVSSYFLNFFSAG